MNRSQTELTAASLSLPQTSGSVLARLVASGVELECRRCKRIVVLPFHTDRPR